MKLNAYQKNEIIRLLEEPKHKKKFKNQRSPQSFVSLLDYYLGQCNKQETPIKRVHLNDSEKDKLSKIVKTANKLFELMEEVDNTEMNSLIRLRERYKPELLNRFGCESLTGTTSQSKHDKSILGIYENPANVVKSISRISETIAYNYKKTTDSDSPLSLDRRFRGTRSHEAELQAKMWCIRQVCNNLLVGVRPTSSCKPTSLFYSLAELVIGDTEYDSTRLIKKFAVRTK